MNSRIQWVTHMKSTRSTRTYSHQTEEWIKMLPSSSKEISESVPLQEESIISCKRNQGNPMKTQIGIYGWRKRCLFTLILVLILLVVFNLCLTLWFMEILQLSSEGIGSLKILKGGVMLNGTAYFMNTMIASSISSRPGEPLNFISSKNLSVSVRDSTGREESNFILSDRSISISATSFNITGPRGEILFAANKKQIIFGTGEVKFAGVAGAVFESSIQTPLIRGHYKRNLNIESVTRMVDIFGPNGVTVESRAGDVVVSCLTHLKFESIAGAIKFEGSKLYLPRLQMASYAKDMVRTEKQSNVTIVYQACLCHNGRLFLSAADDECAATTDMCP